ncbi:Ig-like domain-containing protein, partial [Bradyrhizobium sp. UFLA01-814]|uniref:beta strand repeat-containing protein n=1 Tax=Bradyrhizobium sp. UFLA01-814 TaxID=3023480 RepID=UPI00398AEFEC
TSNAITVTVDNTAPTAGTLAFANLTDTGVFNSPPIHTKDNNFDITLSGNSDANGTSVSYEVSTDGGAHWSTTTTSQTNLADGDYKFRAIVTDPAGNSSTSNILDVFIDNTPPGGGTLSFTNLVDTGSGDTIPITEDGTFNLHLQHPGDDVSGIDSVSYQISLDRGSSWTTSATVLSNLADGDYQFRSVVTDGAGNSSTSNVIEVVVDNTAPSAGTLSFSNLTDGGTANTPPVTTDNTFDLTLSGNSDANGTTVTYEQSTNGGTTWTSTTANQSGLADGDYLFHAVVTDPAGNSSTSNAIEVKVDNTAPSAGTLSFSNLTDTGTANTPPVTTDNTFDLTLSGNSDANGTTVAYEKSTNGGTTWTSTTSNQSGLADGDYLFHAVVTDPAGNSSTSNAIEVKVDNTAPSAGTLSFSNLTDTGTANTPPVTTDNTFSLTLTGNADANGTTVSYEKSTNGGAAWTSTTASQNGLADGDYLFHAIVTDPAGNSSTSNAIEVKIDTTAPTAGTLAFTGLTDTGTADTPPVTTDNTFTLTLTGNADANGTTVSYEKSTNGGVTWTSTSASQSGLADGDYLFHAVVTDPAGNSSTSNVVTVVVDTTNPTAGTLS